MAVKFSQFASTSPTGTTYLVGFDGASNVKVLYSSLLSGTANYLTKWGSPSGLVNSLIFDNGDDIGIGTTSPTSQGAFRVVSINSATGSILDLMRNEISQLQIQATSSVSAFVGMTNLPFSFQTNGSHRMEITGSTGNVIIGGTFGVDSGYKLDVNGTARFQGSTVIAGNGVTNLDVFGGSAGGASQSVRIYGTTPSSQGLLLSYDTGSAISYIDGAYHATASGSAVGDIVFRSKKNGINTLAENMRIRGFDGSVGINTSTPTSGFTLDNNGALRNYGQAAFLMNTGDAGGGNGAVGLGVLPASVSRVSGERVLEIASYYSTIRLKDNQNYVAEFSLGTPRVPYIGTTNAAPFDLMSNNVRQFRLHSNGNIGINTTTDAGYKLDVNGTARVSGVSYLSNGIQVGGAASRFDSPVAIYSTLSVSTIQQPGGAITFDLLANLGRNLVFTNGGQSVGANNYIDFSFTYNSIASGTSNILNVAPTISQTTGAGTIIGYRFNPINTAVLSTVYSFYADSGTAYFGGNVGIGTTSPTNYTGYLTLQIQSTNGGILRLNNTADNRTLEIATTPTETYIRNVYALPLTFYTNNTDRGRIASSGNWLINTTTDAGYKLQISGNAYIKGAGADENTFSLYFENSNNTRQLYYFNDGSLRLTNTRFYGATGEIRCINVDTFFTGFGALENLRCNFAAGVIVNNGSLNNVYLQVKGQTSTNLFYTKPSTDNIGINTNSPDASALLDITSTTKGFLPPRMTGAQAEAIATPAAGLMVYSTNGSGTTITSLGWWGYNGTTWVKLN